MNEQRTFDTLQQHRLGKYIYALRDPRDKKNFYIGQGINNRVFSHFGEADAINSNSVNLDATSSKVIRILDIWKHEEDVEFLILAHNLPKDNNVADYIESGIFDALSESQNGDPLNNVSPPNSSRLSSEEITGIGAVPINPNMAIENVFIFPIQNAVNAGVSKYNATRSSWAVTAKYKDLNPAYAVGLKNAISIGSFKISSWHLAGVDTDNKYEFTSPNHPDPTNYPPLLNKRWTNILEQAKGFWQRGNYLIVDFDGNGQFRIKRGSQNKNWLPLN